MRPNSSNKNMHKFDKISASGFISSKLKEIKLNKIAKQTGFQKGQVQKITPMDFLMGFFLMAFSKGSNSLEAWAAKISFLIGDTLSRQAIFKKINDRQIEFLRNVLAQVIDSVIKGKKLKAMNSRLKTTLKKFRNIWLEDSTCLRLNDSLSKFYPGNANQFKTEKAILRLDMVYNLTKGYFKRFFMTSYRVNDLVNSADIVGIVEKGDLVIRDLGYFVLDVFRQINKKKAFFLSRMRSNISLYDPEGSTTTTTTTEPIDLLRLLKGKNFLDKMVSVSNKEKLPSRLIAIRLDPKIVEMRKRKITNRRYRHSKKYMEMLEFAIFITNCPETMLRVEEVIMLYRLRWRIEIIIKAWKSHLSIGQVILCTNKIRVDSYIYCMLIFIVLFMTDLLICLEDFISGVSILKFYKFITSNLLFLLFLPKEKPDLKSSHKRKKICSENEIIRRIQYYCTYEKRKDRTNFSQLVLNFG